jgi:hypothetical protein
MRTKGIKKQRALNLMKNHYRDAITIPPKSKLEFLDLPLTWASFKGQEYQSDNNCYLYRLTSIYNRILISLVYAFKEVHVVPSTKGYPS